jgi:hypothetical protein
LSLIKCWFLKIKIRVYPVLILSKVVGETVDKKHDFQNTSLILDNSADLRWKLRPFSESSDLTGYSGMSEVSFENLDISSVINTVGLFRWVH